MKRWNSGFRSCRPRARLGMPLERERRPIGALDPLQRAVEQRPMRRATIRRQRVFLHGETVVLARDHDAPRIELDDGVVRAVMAELHLLRLRAAREPQELMPETDAERRHADVDDRADRLDRVVARLRIAGAVRQEHAVRAAAP